LDDFGKQSGVGFASDRETERKIAYHKACLLFQKYNQ